MNRARAVTLVLASICFGLSRSWFALALEPIPEKLVVLTFDDASKSHFTVVRPILLRYGFGATFFITEGFDFGDNKRDYMTWDEIAILHRDGFEIGNHTRDHLAITDARVDQLAEQLEAINARCREHGIPPTVTFAWPGNATSLKGLEVLRAHGILFARRGGAPEYPYDEGRGFAYEPGLDHPLLIPSAGDARPDWELSDFVRAVEQARYGRIAVLQFHGTPDTAHAWVNTPRERFELFMRYLAENGYHVIALRDLAKYVDPTVVPQNPLGVMEDRRAVLARGGDYDDFRRPVDDASLRFWLANMLVDHRFTPVEASAATGMSVGEIRSAASRLGLDISAVPTNQRNGQLHVVPYPGGRHPRIGFRDGAIRPQRETKLSAFAPWEQGGYAVLDVPEAIWWEPATGRELLYLAHTHVPTTWDKQGISLERLEWKQTADGWEVERRLPNGVRFGARARRAERAVRLELWIRNETSETLRGLRVQNCVMLGALPGFDARTSDNKLIEAPFVACHDEQRARWIVTAWERCVRPWTNPPCPCMHSDPQFEDCPPGESRQLRGVVSFYEGTDVRREFARLRQAGFSP